MTMIDDLPSLDEIDGMNTMAPPSPPQNQFPEIDERYSQYIRPSNKRHYPGSGMEPYAPPPMMRPPMGPMGPPGSMGPTEQMAPEPPKVSTGEELSCIDVCHHIQNCPICSKFYNNDRTVYVVIILVLIVICLLLLKKLLKV